MEALLARVAGTLNVKAQFLATPTRVHSVVWDRHDHQRVHISISPGAVYDVTRLSLIMELVSQLESRETTLEDALGRLRLVDQIDSGYGAALDAGAYALCGLGFGVILGVSWLDVFFGSMLSLVSFGMAKLATHSNGVAVALELLAAAVVTALANLLALAFPGSNPLAIAVCALVCFVPGFGLTLGASELMTGHTVSGLIGFTRASVTAVKLVVGTLIGGAVIHAWAYPEVPDVTSGIAHVWTWLFAPSLAIGLAVLFRVRPRDLIWPALGGLLVWLGKEAGAGFGIWQGTLIAAFLLQYSSHQFTRISGLPGAIISLPAVMLLVPGVAALQAIYLAQTQGLLAGLQASSGVLLQIAALLGGLLLGEALWSLRSAAISSVISRRAPR
jgi:uncharacterized membrane protein YjjP (DUF1212 family)